MDYEFILQDWLPKCPLKDMHGNYSGDVITGPTGLCNNEQLRQGMQDEFDWGNAVPSDIFVMADGEPADPYVGSFPIKVRNVQ